MNQLLTQGIILSRTDYGEADRIITLLTPHYGKLRLMARGVRRMKSKIAGGIELFSTSDITFMRGRGEIGTLLSARLINYYDHIVRDIDRVQLGYDLIKQLNKATEDQPEAAYFYLLEQVFMALNDSEVGPDLIKVWFAAQLLRLSGHTPNLSHDLSGAKLASDGRYEFRLDESGFVVDPQGTFAANEIKFMRLLFSANTPKLVAHVEGWQQLTETVLPLVLTFQQLHMH